LKKVPDAYFFYTAVCSVDGSRYFLCRYITPNKNFLRVKEVSEA